MPSLSPSQSRDFFTMPFRKRKYTINPPDDVYNVIYLGNVLTIMGKGEQSIEKPLALIWKAYCSKQQRNELSMKLMVTRSGLKAETKLQGLTEYWAHRITFCSAPVDYPKVFCWVYKHDGKKMKPELRCHAVLCKKATIPAQIASNLNDFLHQALQEYKREKRCIEKARKTSLCTGGHGLGPRRKLLLQSGSLNFRPPVSRSKSAPRLGSIDEEDEIDEQICNEIINEENDDTFDDEVETESTYDRNSERLSEPDFDSSADSSIILQRSKEINNNYGSDEDDVEEEGNEFMKPIRFQRQCSMNSATKRRHQSMPHSTEILTANFQNSCQLEDDDDEEETPHSSDASQIPSSSCASSDDGFTSSCQSGDLEQLHRNQRASLRRRIKALKEPDSISDESGYHESGAGSGSESKITTSQQSFRSIEYSDEDDDVEDDDEFEEQRKSALAAQCLLGSSATIELEPNVQITAL
jgi:hypothetical protein